MTRVLATAGLLLLLPLTSGAAARPAGGTLVAFVSAEDDDELVAVQPITGEVLRRLPVANGPHNVAAAPNGRSVLVTSPPAGRVTLIDARTRRVVKVFGGFGSPHDVEVAPDSRYAYVTDEARGQVAVISLARRRIVRRVPVPAGPHDLAVGPSGRRVWVTHSPRQRSFTLLDSTRPARTSVLRRLPSGVGVGAPHDIAFAPRGQRVWVTYWNSKHVGTYDSRTGRLLALGQVGSLPHHVAVGPERVWVTDHAAGTAVVIDPPARIRRRLPVGPGAHHVSILVGVAVAVSHDAGTAVAFREHGARIRSTRVGNGLHGVALVFNP